MPFDAPQPHTHTHALTPTFLNSAPFEIPATALGKRRGILFRARFHARLAADIVVVVVCATRGDVESKAIALDDALLRQNEGEGKENL